MSRRSRRSGTARGHERRSGRPFAGAALVALAVALGAAAASAQDPTSEPLTLEEAITRARLNNPAYRRTVNNVELNDVERREFWYGFLPDPSVTLLSTNMTWNQQTLGTDNFGNPVPNPETRLIQSATSNQGARLDFQIDFADLYRRRATRVSAQARTIDAALGAEDLGADVRVAFLDVQERTEARALEERIAEIYAVNSEMANQLFRLAQVDRPDLLGAELDYVDQENRLEESRAALESARLRLRNLIGDPDLGDYELVPTELRVFDPERLDVEALIDAASVGGPQVRRAELDVQASETNASIARATTWIPTINLFARTGRNELSRETGGAFFQPSPEGEWDKTFGVSLSFPDLGNYLNRRSAAQREDIAIRNANQSLRETRLQVEEDVIGLALDLENQYRTLDIQDRRAALARERLALEQERYRLGQIDYGDLQTAVQTVSDAERSALAARYGFERALIDLERALGGPIEIPQAD